jgi:hypothetical protein
MASTEWRSAEGTQAALALTTNYPQVFSAIAEIDALGHRLLKRVAGVLRTDAIETLVVAALLRRLVTQYVGIRHLLEASAVEQTKPLMRAQWETRLAIKALLKDEEADQAATADIRESRARFYYVAAERQAAYAHKALIDGVSGETVRTESAAAAIQVDLDNIIARLSNSFPNEMEAFGPLRYQNSRRKPLYYDHLEWYTLARPVRKPASLRELAESLKVGWEYHMMYGALSGSTHARGITHDVRVVPPGELEIFHPYMSDAFELVAHWSSMWQLDSLIAVVDAFHRDSKPDVESVYRKVIQTLHGLSNEPPVGFFYEGA